MIDEKRESVWIGENKYIDCGNLLTRAQSGESEALNEPQEGDFSVCLYCAEIMVFVDSKLLRKATGYEKNELKKRMQEEQPDSWEEISKIRNHYLVKKSSRLN